MAPPCHYHQLAQVHANDAADLGLVAFVGFLESYQTQRVLGDDSIL